MCLAESGVQPLNAVDGDGEVRSGLEVGLMESAVKDSLFGVGSEVAVGIQSERVG